MIPGAHFLDDLARRDRAVSLARYAVNGDHGRWLGDPVHEEVTQGRQWQWERAKARGEAWATRMVYSSCGDLAHWLLWRLGARGPQVNREEPEDGLRWRPGQNLIALSSSPAWVQAGGGREPKPGDVLHFDQHDGHVAVLLDLAAGETADYGQPYGKLRRREYEASGGGWRANGVKVTGWLDLDRVGLGAMPDLRGIE